MWNDNPLLSGEGFKYISDKARTGVSNLALKQLLDSFSAFNLSELKEDYEATRFRVLKKAKQISGLANILKESLGEDKEVIELCCGSGKLAMFLAANLGYKVKGIDINEDLMKNASEEADRKGLSVSFEACDAFEFTPEKSYDAVIALHACGSLADRVIKLYSGNNSVALVVAPCCYSKITKPRKPISNTISQEKFARMYDEAFKKVCRFECSPGKEGSYVKILADVYRLLINLDRMLFLKEKGYRVSYSPFIQKRNTPHNYAIIAVNSATI